MLSILWQLSLCSTPLCLVLWRPCWLYNDKNIKFGFMKNSGLYYKYMTIVNVYYKLCQKLEHHSRVIKYAPRVITYALRVITYALRVINYAPIEHLLYWLHLRSSLKIVIYDRKIFMLLATYQTMDSSNLFIDNYNC